MIPEEWKDLFVTVEVEEYHIDLFARNMIGVRVLQRGVEQKWGYFLPMNREFYEDQLDNLDRLIFRMADKGMRPWLYPKVTPFPHFDLFPRWTKIETWWRNLTKRYGTW